MVKALAKKSDYLKVKYKFFLNRALTYFSFLLIPIWIQQTQSVNFLFQSIILIMYMIFMVGQWYLLGKEIDHRLKIYYRVNSSVERTSYRVFMGSMGMLFLFNLFSLFPSYFVGYLFWGFFALFGLFYSWPTRGKIIEDSMTNQFGEIKFLDSFEKTVFLLSIITFIFSLPEIPLFENIDALKLYFDPNEKVNNLLWNYLSILYLPFTKYPKLYNLIWSFHFYFIGLGLFLVALYGLLRHFFSRRLSILGIFSVISSWSFSKILAADYLFSVTSTINLIWVWSILWSTRSGTYRSGIFTGFVCFFATIVNAHNFILLPITLCLFYFSFLKDQTSWYKRQWLKYNIFGGVFALLVFLYQSQSLEMLQISQFKMFVNELSELIYRKAFFVIAPIGVILSSLLFFKEKIQFNFVNFNIDKFKELSICILFIIFVSQFINPDFYRGFSLMWLLAFFALVPLEWIFQSISRLRSKRNLIYALYILVCLLDSHLENRIRIIAKMFLDDENLKYLIQF